MSHVRSWRRFTLVELMIVVAIIAILAAVAIPLMADFQLRAKRAEGPTNLDGLATTLEAYRSGADCAGIDFLCGLHLPALPSPTGLGKNLRAFSGHGGDWSTLGWAPDGYVRGSYGEPWGGACLSEVYISVGLDVDADGVMWVQHKGYGSEYAGCGPDPGSVCGASAQTCF